MNSTFWIKNAQLESGFQVENDIVTGTETKVCHLFIKDGEINKIVSAKDDIDDNLPFLDAKQLLLLPSFVEKHCHLDKTLLGDKWRGVTPVRNIFERFDIEKKVLPALKTTTTERAEKLLGISLKAGATHIRTHVDIYPEVGLQNLESVQNALNTFDQMLSYEIVAFPQHGLLRTNAKEAVKEAIRQGATLVGGVDPGTVDGDIEASLQEMVEIAVEGNVGIDLHLHDSNSLGIFTMKRLVQLTIEAGLQGKVSISHAFALGDIPPNQAIEMAELLRDAGITIITSVPLTRKFPPVGLLHDKGVSVAVGCDNIFDVWSPFGNGDILERASRLAEISGWVDEKSLAKTLRFITGGKSPLNDEGKQVWPQIGDEASMVFVQASSSAETIARRAERVATMFKGKIVSGSLENTN
ncbi:amidohydrolase [Lederbergia wuyishanensis]|uniref:Cytosine/adenosine deaminase-related metal-dependent hydrolase n=1 Tax=Lederbergia wuyishanensis TaxID=1347903 RepID=A0ABU0D5M8_9BACI|nr:amidohydrolase [Lederbergia wuyishanensis]MCJ8009840.1 amidohydrolase [Lederbergia wuyishanensis]MDQ0343696.1 cytosine/adenosine deaminase-related metal-dependent hydrolase [Lederbergia wuyishanensis]